jgi:hypothetical protein
MVLKLLEYKRASRAFRKQAVKGVGFIAFDEHGNLEPSPEWDRMEKAWERLVLNRPWLERLLSQPKVYQWIS